MSADELSALPALTAAVRDLSQKVQLVQRTQQQMQQQMLQMQDDIGCLHNSRVCEVSSLYWPRGVQGQAPPADAPRHCIAVLTCTEEQLAPLMQLYDLPNEGPLDERKELLLQRIGYRRQVAVA